MVGVGYLAREVERDRARGGDGAVVLLHDGVHLIRGRGRVRIRVRVRVRAG